MSYSRCLNTEQRLRGGWQIIRDPRYGRNSELPGEVSTGDA
jgi:hypothetical protein